MGDNLARIIPKTVFDYCDGGRGLSEVFRLVNLRVLLIEAFFRGSGLPLPAED
jgi:hypothetical protein